MALDQMSIESRIVREATEGVASPRCGALPVLDVAVVLAYMRVHRVSEVEAK